MGFEPMTSAEGLPVLVGTAAGGLLSLTSSCFESIAGARAGILLVVQQCLSLGLSNWLHLVPVHLEPVCILAMLQCCIGRDPLVEGVGKSLYPVGVRHAAGVDAGSTHRLGVVDPLWLQPDLAGNK